MNISNFFASSVVSRESIYENRKFCTHASKNWVDYWFVCHFLRAWNFIEPKSLRWSERFSYIVFSITCTNFLRFYVLFATLTECLVHFYFQCALQISVLLFRFSRRFLLNFVHETMYHNSKFQICTVLESEPCTYFLLKKNCLLAVGPYYFSKTTDKMARWQWLIFPTRQFAKITTRSPTTMAISILYENAI